MQHPLNRDAGSVPLPSNPRELALALRASRVSLRAFPYYGFRYGERGARFGDSDSAFLMTLAEVPADAAERQVLWLVVILAARGMPSWLLEVHLRVVARMVTREFGSGARFAALAAAADTLAARRRARLSDEAFAELGRFFAERAGFAGRRFAEGTGRMIASAAVDTALGVDNALENLVGWLASRERFDAGWCAAVRATASRAQRMVR